QFTGLQLFAEQFARASTSVLTSDGGDNALFGGSAGSSSHVFAHFSADHGDGAIHQIADDLLHVAANIADFGKLRRFDLDKGCAGQFGEAAADLGLADAGRADHQDIF